MYTLFLRVRTVKYVLNSKHSNAQVLSPLDSSLVKYTSYLGDYCYGVTAYCPVIPCLSQVAGQVLL